MKVLTYEYKIKLPLAVRLELLLCRFFGYEFRECDPSQLSDGEFTYLVSVNSNREISVTFFCENSQKSLDISDENLAA